MLAPDVTVTVADVMQVVGDDIGEVGSTGRISLGRSDCGAANLEGRGCIGGKLARRNLNCPARDMTVFYPRSPKRY